MGIRNNLTNGALRSLDVIKRNNRYTPVMNTYRAEKHAKRHDKVKLGKEMRMKKVLKIRYSHDMHLVLEGTDMQRVSIFARTKEGRQEAFVEILKKIDEGYELDVQFSLEAMFLRIMEEHGEMVNGGARNKRQFPVWKLYDFSKPPEYSPEEIREGRKAIGINQTQLGKICVQSYPMICRWEQGSFKPNVHQRRILQFLFGDPYVLLDCGILSPRYDISERTTRFAMEEANAQEPDMKTRKKPPTWDDD